jgi:hypothetical protein
MKRKSLLFVMASVCLFSCQQQEELQDPSNGVIDFSTSIDQSINNALTRNSSSLTLPLKSNFAAGDVISMSVAEQDYHPFAIGMDSQTWNEAGTDSETVTFYAHYPELTDEAATTRSLSSRYREIKGGLEYLFGTAQANKGSKNVALAFKRMTTPVVLLDENNQPYEGRAIVKLFLKNKGVQDLMRLAERAQLQEAGLGETLLSHRGAEGGESRDVLQIEAELRRRLEARLDRLLSGRPND